MDSTGQLDALVRLAGVVAGEADADLVVRAALPVLLEISDADTALVLRHTRQGRVVEAHAGAEVDPRLLDLPAPPLESTALADVQVPASWSGQGITRVAVQKLPGSVGSLVLTWSRSVHSPPALEIALATVENALGRAESENRLAALTRRVVSGEQESTRLKGLVDSAPDAILVLDSHQQVLDANVRARTMLGGDPVGHRVQEIVPTWTRSGMTGVEAVTLDGRPLRLDVVNTAVSRGDGGPVSERLVGVHLRDAAQRVAGEALAGRLRVAQLRRRQALEINDNVVQGIVAAAYALEQGQVEAAGSYLERTLDAARTMMDDLLDPLSGEGLRAGDLVRSAPTTLGHGTGRAAVVDERTVAPSQHRVLLVDDADDLRLLMRSRMETREDLTIVGEAADGLAAVELASELQPDLVMLDLAMPRMDGLEALPLIRTAVPGVRVIVLSGFNQSTLAEKALAAGADHYVVKGGSMQQLLDLVDSVLQPAS